MIDEEGYRANIGIILTNSTGQLFWAKRKNQEAWQFPQGGIDENESEDTALFRELHEEIGLLPTHVDILGCTADWLKYTLPPKYLRHSSPSHFIGQKQKWFLLSCKNEPIDPYIDFNTSETPEFDGWRWIDYWYAPTAVISFKQSVYQQALSELEPIYARFVSSLK